MATVPAILLSLVLPAAEPLSPAELDFAVAALEESLTRLQAFEVTYRTWQVRHKKGETSLQRPSAQEFTKTWAWKNGRQHFLRTRDDSRDEWWYDGKKTYVWSFDSEDPGKIVQASIYHSPPGSSTAVYDLTRLMGFGGPQLKVSLLESVKHAQTVSTLSGERVDGKWILTIKPDDVDVKKVKTRLTLDPDHDYRLVSWERERPRSVGVSEGYLHQYLVDEFQTVVDEVSRDSVWYPLRGRILQSELSTWIEVDTVRINHDPPETLFSPAELPFGTQVEEFITPGESPKRYLVGGEKAEEERLAQMAAAAEKERERLMREGVTFDATPRASSSAYLWYVLGSLLLASGAFLHWRRRRAA